MPVYQIMVKGCHRQGENMSFSLKMPKRFRDRRDRSHKHPVDKFVNSFYQAGLLCH
jgi:hypothetical protein